MEGVRTFEAEGVRTFQAEGARTGAQGGQHMCVSKRYCVGGWSSSVSPP